MDEQTELDRLTIRADKQAAAIRRLRKDRDAFVERVEGLEERVEFLETALGALFQQDQPGQPGATPSTTPSAFPTQADQTSSVRPQAGAVDVWAGGALLPVVPLVEAGTWVERGCLVCGAAKEAGRKAMTCARCSTARTEAIKGKRAKPAIPQCLNCGAAKGAGGLIFVCAVCRPIRSLLR